MAATFLIASNKHLPALKEREDLKGAVTFPDSDALKALEAITRKKPGVVVLERMFAATSRGAALINRIKADPSLNSCEIRIVAHDSDYARVSPRRDTEPAGASKPAAAVAVAEAPAPAVAPLDQRGTRRAARVPIVAGVEMQVDGNPASIIDLSPLGAQVVSATILKPNQRVRISLPHGQRVSRISAAVAWASFEIPKAGPRYRAGIEFFDADHNAVTKLIEKKKK